MKHDTLLELRHIKKHFVQFKGVFRRPAGLVKAVDDVSLAVNRGETVGIVGESGCGKTTLGRCIVQLLPVTQGTIHYLINRELKDLRKISPEEKIAMRQRIQIVFQDSLSSLNPALSIYSSFSEPMKIHGIRSKSVREQKIAALLESVEMPPDIMYRYPKAFSGGERQRICIARALSVDPELMIFDEAVSSLDVSIQAQILNLLKHIQNERGLTFVFISHNLSIVEYISDRIAIMYLGKIVELISADDLLCGSVHPYTHALLSALPSPRPDQIGKEPLLLSGESSISKVHETGCRFYPRCQQRQPVCLSEEPELIELSGQSGHWVACHFPVNDFRLI